MCVTLCVCLSSCVKFVCVCEVMCVCYVCYVKFVCVKLLSVKFVYVKFVCSEGGGGEGGARDTESKTRTPHKDVGKNQRARTDGLMVNAVSENSC